MSSFLLGFRWNDEDTDVRWQQNISVSRQRQGRVVAERVVDILFRRLDDSEALSLSLSLSFTPTCSFPVSRPLVSIEMRTECHLQYAAGSPAVVLQLPYYQSLVRCECVLFLQIGE
jgi:hypothetical protein